MASEFVSYVGRLISVRSVVQLYPGPFHKTQKSKVLDNPRVAGVCRIGTVVTRCRVNRV